MDDNVGAQKTGAVWSACDDILSKLPRGNRACMRREIFTWVADCNETMQEFQDIVEHSSTTSVGDDDVDVDDEEDFVSEERYSSKELGIAIASLALIKCSRGILGLVLKACECAGESA